LAFRLRLLAFIDVAKRYRETIRYHWRNRNAETRKPYSKSEAEFLPASLALIEKPVSPTARITGLLLVFLAFTTIGWAVVSRVDIVVTATGKVIPSSRTKTIASVDVASVRAIFVVEGQSVRAGDVLVELDAGSFEADERKAEGDVGAARLEIARSKALIVAIDSNRPPMLARLVGIAPEKYEEAKSHLIGQHLDYQAKVAQLDGEISRYTRALPLAQERARSYEDLANTHDVSVNAWSEKKQAAIDLEGQLTQAQNARLSLIAGTRRQALDSLSDAEKIVTSATQDAARAVSHARLLTLRAPVDGSVQQLTVHTIGGVVPAAQPLMLIVPKDDKVEVEGYVENKDIGFVSEGQSAEVKIDAFDYTKHGMIHGFVDSISRDAVDDEKRGPIFKTNVSLDRVSIDVEGHQVLLTPGMTVQVEIKTGTRHVIEYVLSPLLRHRHESLNER
jgi:hemolysin D